ncbi:MAG: sulfatase-like hydrolase/transferase [Opitutaceae bacterium]|nr:sulfatase-like hydrolase/transferase [Opitutaceae bacterium]
MRPPDVILIMCDQWRPDCLGFLGHPVVRTPHLDALAARGAAFVNAYCASPLCSPARGSWLTGRYPHAHGQLRNYGSKAGRPGAQMDPAVPTLGDAFKRAGYRCGIVGPWHLGDDHRPQHGFEDGWETYRYQGAGRPDRFYDYVRAQGLPNVYDRKDPAMTARVVEEPGFGRCVYTTCDDLRQQRTTWTVDRGLAFLERHGGGPEPAFLFLSVKDPHPIIAPPRDLLALYPPAELPLPPNLDDPLAGKPRYQTEAPYRLPVPVDRAAFRRLLAHYYALLTHVDREVGRIVAHLERAGRLDNTLLAFISDHGEMLGEHGLLAKNKFYEPSVRVPCLVSLPGRVRAGQRVRTPLAGVDLAPTLLDLAGAPPLADIDGRSLAAALRAGREPEPQPVFAELCSPAAQKGRTDDESGLAAHLMVRDGDWKYVRNRDDLDELYDLAADPGEMVNLAAEASSAPRIARLRDLGRQMLLRHGPGAYSWFVRN